MSQLPPGWATVAIGDLVEADPKNRCADATEVGFVPMQRMGTRFRDTPSFEVRRWSAVKKGYTSFADGDVLLARITPCFENGKAGIPRRLPNGLGAGSTEFFVLRPKPNALVSEYLLAALKTDQFLSDGKASMTGAVGQQRVPKSLVLNHSINLAPLSEQKRIADKIEAVLARVDGCRERLDRVPLIMKRFREAVLEAAVSGRLTEVWRADATGSKGLSTWTTATVADVADVGTGSTPLRSRTDFYSNKGTPWVTSAATARSFVKEASEYLTAAAVAANRLRVYPIGTLLVAMYGEGKTRGQVSELAIEATINQACAAIVVNEAKARREYVKVVLMSAYEEMRRLAEGGNQPNLNLSKIKTFPVPLPPIAEQREIVRRVGELLSLAGTLDAKYKTAVMRVEKLTPAVLSKAFKGKLVAQHAGDEPASLLLEKICKERAANSGGRSPEGGAILRNTPHETRAPKTKISNRRK